ncbi:MAG: response regulator, partial [Planctomycetes bacterium]|nr:response regulator [Planctomycetota bacterium]
FAGEAILRDRDDKTLPCFIDVSRGEDEAGDVIRYYASITDITDLSQTRQHLAQKNLELMAADQAKSRFLANMSHELRTPLNAIMGFSEVIKNEMFGPVGLPQYVEYAVDIHNSGAHLLAIINDILDLSKVEAGKFELSEEEVDLREVIAAVGNLVKGRSEEKDITLETIIPDPAPRLYADKRTLKQMLLNLLSNAIKFTPKGGHVTITGSIGGNNEILLAVSDNGIGMSPETRKRVFEPFFTTKSRAVRRGRGMGLAIVYGAVRNAGGFIEIESRPGDGTTFRVHIPATDGIPEPIQPPTESRVPSAGGGTILLVDEDPAIRDVARAALEERDYSVITADSAEDAKAKIQTLDVDDRNVAVVDLDLSDELGTRLAKELLETCPSLRVVFMTASEMRDIPAEIADRVTGQIAKPFTLEALTGAVATAMTAHEVRR